MTKIPVNIPEFVPNMSVPTSKVQETGSKDDFSKILERQKASEAKMPEKAPRDDGRESYDDSADEVRSADENQELDAANVSKESEVKETASTDSEKETGQEEEQEFSQEALHMMIPVLNVAVTDIKELLATELGISIEEVNAMMENMQISDEQLMDFDVVKEMFIKASGAEDVTALLTDESLLNGMQNLEMEFAQVMENVQETIGVTEDDMAIIQEQLSRLNQPKEPVITIESTLENPVETEVVKTGTDIKQEEAPTENNQAFQWTGQNTMFTTGNMVGTEAVAQSQNSFTAMQAADVMNQIMDYMKVQLNADTSFLEMQLQPESLGTLQIRISAKEGLMTAQFTTASENVKAVLESQMVQLQQQLESQNIKVDAIEVTVETHAFESALQQGDERQQTGEEKKARTRRIDLNGMADVEELAEEDRIVADMMAANGNTVDYLA